MKQPLPNARRWLRQAEYDFEQAKKSAADGAYSYAAFFSEQAAQKALKAVLFKSGKRQVTIHSLAELAREASRLEKAFELLIEEGARLDRHYLASRYPDALPEPAIPSESYSKKDAEEALAQAQEFLSLARKLIA
ncbi:MAG: hypothetical protein A3G20_07460 [Acidobacteria bacterium RIFCSPLOWO2_12_FULL_59_11]|nr:MAG: hypothetical protein A3G20_07460 [Acidobacteria bacterium RIFCSPLOWO2_12_FULL_59_11]